MSESAITGAAGAYFAAAELSHRGWIASLTWGNTPRTDILAQSLDPPILVAVQVKARDTGDFQLGVHGEDPSTPGTNEWYILVSLGDVGARPDYYVVPRDHVSALAHIGYRTWLAEPGRGGRKRNAHSKRDHTPEDFAGYHEAWELLEAPASKAPWRLDEWLWDEVDVHGLPEGHPGLGPRSE